MTRKFRRTLGTLALLALTACGGDKTSSPTAERTLHRGLAGEPSTLDPLAAADNFSYDVLRDVYEGLTTETPSGDVVPGVAATWDVDAGGTRYTFHLRPEARWSNGKPVRAGDFVAAWRRVVDPKEGSPVADDLRLIAGATAIIEGKAAPDTLGAEAVSDAELVVRLDQPAAYFPQLLTHAAAYPIFSAASAASRSPLTWVSNGAYVLAGWSPGTAVALKANPLYWDHAHVHIARVDYQVADDLAQYARYRAGALDLTDSVPANALQTLRAERPKELVIAPFLATAYYGLNLSAKPLGTSRELRQALAMAIDRRRLVAALAFGQSPALGFVPPGTWNYTPQTWAWKDLSDADRIAEARRLYAASGHASQPLHLRLLFNSNPMIKNTAIIVASMWKEVLGVETTLAEEEYKVFLQSRHDKTRWEVARLGWTADYNDASNFLDTFRTHSVNNDAGYANPAVDQLLDQAAAQPDARRRREDLESAEHTLLDDYPIVPLYFFVSKRLVKPNVLGVTANPLNRVRSAALSFADGP